MKDKQGLVCTKTNVRAHTRHVYKKPRYTSTVTQKGIKLTRQKTGKGGISNSVLLRSIFNPPKRALVKRPKKQKTGKGIWGSLAQAGLSTAAKGIWDLSAAGKEQRKRDLEELNRLRAKHYANHYHFRG